MKKVILACSTLLLVTACGGGDSSSPPIANKPVTLLPTVSITLSAQKIHVNETVKVSWTSTNATSCNGSGDLSGTRLINGDINFTPTMGGQYTYTLTCTGNGGSVNTTANLVVPMQVWPTSYANTKLITLSDPNLPRPIDVGIVPSAVSSPFPWFQGGSGAFADFFQEGAYSAVVQLTQWRDGNTSVPVNAPSRIYFLRRSPDGKWSDTTPKILADTTGCISPRKAVVADFNGDKKPDVFYSCHGYDGEPTDPNRPPYGDNQRILLSQIDGTYKNIKLPFVGYGHGASAADLNGDGFPDLVVTNTIGNSSAGYDNPFAVTNRVPYVLINRGDGSFYLDLDRLPKAKSSDVTTLQYWGIYGVELIDTKGDGKPDLFVGGLPESFANGCKGCARNGIMYNDGTGRFDKRPMEFFTTFQNATGTYFGGALDFVYDNGFLYFHHEAVGSKPQEIAVRKFKLSDMSVSTIYTHVGTYRDGQTWPTWIKPDGKGNITSRELGCAYPIASDSVCGIIFKQ